MATDKITKLLEINVNSQQAIKSVADYQLQIEKVKQAQGELRKAIADLRREQKETTEAMKDNGATAEQVAAMEKAYEDKIRQKTESLVEQNTIYNQLKKEQGVIEKQLRQNVLAENAEEESLVALRAELSNLTAMYDALSKDDRLGEKGEELKTQINDVTEKLKTSEEATQRFYRNVGNYRNSIIAAFDAMDEAIEKDKQKLEELKNAEGDNAEEIAELTKKIELNTAVNENAKKMNERLLSSIIPFGDKIIPLLGNGLTGLKTAFSTAAQGASLLGKQFVALMANPIVAFLALLSATIMGVVKAVGSSEENMTKWHKVIAPVTRTLGFLEKGLQKVAGVILSAVAAGEGMLLFLAKLGERLPIVGGAIKSINDANIAAIELEQRKYNIAKKSREYEVQNAKDALEISQLRSVAEDKYNHTQQERLEANRKAQALEQARADKNVELAQERLAILQEEASYSDNNAETNEKIAQAEAEVYNARREQYEKQRELMGQEKSLRDEMANDAKAKAQEAQTLAKERNAAELAAMREAEDAMLVLVKDSGEQRRRQIVQTYEREIEDLQTRLQTEKNLTTTARDAINQTIKAKEQAMMEELAALDAELSAEAIQRKQDEIALKLEAVRQGAAEEFALRRDALNAEMEAELNAAEQEIANAEELAQRKALIRAKYAEQERQIAVEQQAQTAEVEKQAIENRFEELMQAAQNNSVEQARIELDRRRTDIEALQQMEGESAEAFRARELAAQKAYNEAKASLTEQENKVTETRLDVAQQVTSGIGAALSALGDDNEDFAKASKVLALAEVAINTGKAIAAGVAQAQSVPFPANLAAISSTIAAVMSNIATAISTIKSAHFATGAVDIRGAGTATSDSIPAMISNGESVMNAQATDLFAPLLVAMNAIGRGVVPQVAGGLSMAQTSPDAMAQSIAAGVRDIRPVVSVEDINEGQRRVSVIETLDTL